VFEGEDAFRFGHALIREVAYDGLPKRRRAELHERVADWLQTKPGVQDEIIGHHLAQACGYWSDLGLVGERERSLAASAAEHLAAAGAAASLRGDPRAAARLLEQAVALLDNADPARPSLLHHLGVALFEAGSLAEADRVLAEAVELGDARLEAHARVDRQHVLLQTQPNTGLGQARRIADSALQSLAEYDDDLGQCRAWCLRASVDWTKGHMADADAAWQQAAAHAQRAGDERELIEILGWRAAAAVFGPMPVGDGIRLCTATRERLGASPVATALVLHPLATLHAMAGEFDEARELIAEGNAILADLGRLQQTASHHETLVELLAGRPDEAERKLRPGYELLDAMGERLLLSMTAALLAQAVLAQGRDHEAAELCRVSQQTAAQDDVATQVLWRGVSAQILVAHGDTDRAEALAREAVLLAEPTDQLMLHADALLHLALVLRHVGRDDESRAAATRALDLNARKGNRVGVQRARSLLDETAPI
jgi:tetratricopeptide (TPR) repeat protein